jgi:hypothetical protein
MQLFFGWLAWLLTVLGGYLAVLGAVLCLSCGLYYAAELAEEHSVLTGRLLGHATKGVVAGHVVLWLDGFPFGRCLTGVLCHGVYAWLLNDYPRLELSSPAFLLAVVAFLVAHYSWFSFLAGGGGPFLPFVNSLGFFAVFVWLVPFSLFVSLSINDNELPLGAHQAPRSSSLFKRLADGARGLYGDNVAPALQRGAERVAPHGKRY